MVCECTNSSRETKLKGKSRAQTHAHTYMHRTLIHTNTTNPLIWEKRPLKTIWAYRSKHEKRMKESEESRIVDACRQCHSDKYIGSMLLFDVFIRSWFYRCRFFRVSVWKRFKHISTGTATHVFVHDTLWVDHFICSMSKGKHINGHACNRK